MGQKQAQQINILHRFKERKSERRRGNHLLAILSTKLPSRAERAWTSAAAADKALFGVSYFLVE